MLHFAEHAFHNHTRDVGGAFLLFTPNLPCLVLEAQKIVAGLIRIPPVQEERKISLCRSREFGGERSSMGNAAAARPKSSSHKRSTWLATIWRKSRAPRLRLLPLLFPDDPLL
jgi:hypothetical protein